MLTLQAKDYFHSPADQVAVIRQNPQEDMEEHAHDFGEIVIVTQGGGYNVVNDRARRVCAGSVFYLMPDDCHAFEEVNGLGLTNVLFKMPERYRPLLCAAGTHENDTLWEIGNTTRRQVEHLLAALSAEPGSFSLGLARSCYMEGVFLQLVALLCQARYTVTPGIRWTRVRANWSLTCAAISPSRSTGTSWPENSICQRARCTARSWIKQGSRPCVISISCA